MSATELNSFSSTALVNEFEGEQGDRFMTHGNEVDLTQSLFAEAEKELEMESRCVWYLLINSDYVAPNYKAMMKMLGISIGMI